MLRKSRHILILLILSLLVLGLTAHSLPTAALCACVNPSDDTGSAPPMEACLVCLLQAGVCCPYSQTISTSANLRNMDEIPSPNPLEHPIRITHPPTLD
jgi:hypothetical protein